MIIKTTKTISENAVTSPDIFKQRRQILKSLAGIAVSSITLPTFAADQRRWPNLAKGQFSLSNVTPTDAELVKNYTNYYEFAYNKEDSTRLAQALKTEPWSVEISGEVEKTLTLYLEDILRGQTLEERIYRFRCVEAWSAVIPWVGFPLANLLKAVKPLSSAKFVKFTTLYQPDVMTNQRNTPILEWPYVEALRMDEAMHPLTILAIGMYGDTLPKQNGAPLRLVVPWKYGFKSIKAIAKIELLKKPPLTSWHKSAPQEYGFYANVNPAVPHPRWSQSSERVLGSGFFTARRPTEIFNGYAEQVASLYRDLDLQHFF